MLTFLYHHCLSLFMLMDHRSLAWNSTSNPLLENFHLFGFSLAAFARASLAEKSAMSFSNRSQAWRLGSDCISFVLIVSKCRCTTFP